MEVILVSGFISTFVKQELISYMPYIKEKIELEHTTITLYDNTILEIELNDNFFYTIKEASEINHVMNKLVVHGKMRALLLAGSYSDCDTETRMFISSDEICSKLIAMALVTRSIAQDILGNFIVAYDRPSKPAKVFRSKQKATKWILEIK
jgi:hypothetical protein